MYRVLHPSKALFVEETDILDALDAMRSLGLDASVVRADGELMSQCEELDWEELHLLDSQAGYPNPYELPFPERVREVQQRKAA